jgi:hypothetical protein
MTARRGSRSPAFAFLAAYALLLLAWSFASPPFAAPDEAAHFIRAVGIANGQLVGPHASIPLAPGSDPVRIAWLNELNHAVELPHGLSPVGWDCPWTDATVPATCQLTAPKHPPAGTQATYVGGYPPASYVLPGLAARVASEPGDGDRLARLASAAICVGLLGLALLLLWDGRSSLSLLGLVVAATPMVVFVCSTLNPSALEIAAGLAFGAAVIQLSRPPYGTTATWLGFGIGGALLALSRPTGAFWVVFLLVSGIAFGGIAVVRTAIRRRPLATAGACSAVLAGLILNGIWEKAYGADLTVSLHPFRSSVEGGAHQLRDVFAQEIGVFGHLEVSLPFLVYCVWWGLLFALLTIALLVATLRQRLVLLGSIAGVIVAPVALHVVVYRFTGFGLQGRHFLAIATMVPLLAGEIVLREHERLPGFGSRRLLLWFTGIAGLVQVVAWFVNARRFATGTGGPIWFVADALWAPPLGWWPWLLTALAAFPVFVLAARSASRAEGRAS